MMDFSKYRSTGLTITSDAVWEEYRAWAVSRVCACGKKASDRTSAEPWATEEECGDCFRRKCVQRQRQAVKDTFRGMEG